MDLFPREASGTEQVAGGMHNTQDTQSWQRRQRRRRTAAASMASHSAILVLGLVLCLASSAQAAFVNFQNCLPAAWVADDTGSPKLLQFDPANATASIDLEGPAHMLEITIYGNVSGQSTKDPLQPWNNETYWANATNGKIVNESNHLLTTLFPKLWVLNYKNYAGAEAFCDALDGDHPCPLGPVFKT